MAGKYVALLNKFVELLESDPASPNLQSVKRYRVDLQSISIFPSAFAYLSDTTFTNHGIGNTVADNNVNILLAARHTDSQEQADEELELLLDNSTGQGIEEIFKQDRNKIIQVKDIDYTFQIDKFKWGQSSDVSGYISYCVITFRCINRSGIW